MPSFKSVSVIGAGASGTMRRDPEKEQSGIRIVRIERKTFPDRLTWLWPVLFQPSLALYNPFHDLMHGHALPCHGIVVGPLLKRLLDAGFRMATLTNSPAAGVQAQTRHAGIDAFFEKQLSVESVGRFKPDRSVYEWAAREMGVAPADCMLVAAHGWDVAGAQWAGLRSAFIAREGQQKFPLAEPPEIDVADLSTLAEKLGA